MSNLTNCKHPVRFTTRIDDEGSVDVVCVICAIEVLQAENNTLKARNKKHVDKLNDWAETYKKVIEDGTCASDEYHCTCVPVLREELGKMTVKMACGHEGRYQWPPFDGDPDDDCQPSYYCLKCANEGMNRTITQLMDDVTRLERAQARKARKDAS